MYRVSRGVLSGEERVPRRFLSRRGRDARRRAGRDREGKSALSVHSHPFDHSSSISGLDVECNSRRRARGTERAARWEREGQRERIKCWESKQQGRGRDKGNPGRKEER